MSTGRREEIILKTEMKITRAIRILSLTTLNGGNWISPWLS